MPLNRLATTIATNTMLRRSSLDPRLSSDRKRRKGVAPWFVPTIAIRRHGAADAQSVSLVKRVSARAASTLRGEVDDGRAVGAPIGRGRAEERLDGAKHAPGALVVSSSGEGGERVREVRHDSGAGVRGRFSRRACGSVRILNGGVRAANLRFLRVSICNHFVFSGFEPRFPLKVSAFSSDLRESRGRPGRWARRAGGPRPSPSATRVSSTCGPSWLAAWGARGRSRAPRAAAGAPVPTRAGGESFGFARAPRHRRVVLVAAVSPRRANRTPRGHDIRAEARRTRSARGAVHRRQTVSIRG